MSITDELRKLAHGFHVFNEERLLAIADRIDAEHDREMIEIRTRGWSNGYDEGFASADDWFAQHEDAMAEHGWVRGPIGADGKPMAKEDKAVDDKGDIGVIVETRFNDDNWFVLLDFGEGHSARFVWFLPKSLTHYHAPTVEDVLREFTDAILEWAGKSGTVAEVGTWSDVAAEYAKRLTLAEGEDA